MRDDKCVGIDAALSQPLRRKHGRVFSQRRIYRGGPRFFSDSDP
jgi:hypothetical protein